MKPRVSVIIPAYNAAPYLARAIESVLAQTERALEVIVVDDASSDDTLAVARSFTDPRVRVLQNPGNRGPSYSRNRAIEAAQGTWIALLDADDWYVPERLERLLEAAEQEQADLLADDHYRIDDGADAPSTTQFRTCRRIIRSRFAIDAATFVRTTRTGTPSLRLGCSKPLMRRAFLQQHRLRYDEDVWFCEDFLLYLQCLLRGGRFVVVPEAYYYRRMHGTSITAGDIVRMLEHEIALTTRLLRSPLVQAQPPVEAALRNHQRDLERHLAFRRIERAEQARSLPAFLYALYRDPKSLAFVAHRVSDRVRQRILQVWQILSTGRDGYAPPV